MRVLARAKLNLHLSILAREATGYHQLETLFCRLDLADELDVESGGRGVRLRVDGPDLGPAESNLAVRAAEAFLAHSGVAGGADIHLTKRIPVGGGLGGGSSDAAATLVALNTLHGEPLRPDELLELGAALGADVPFFVADEALALAWGRGERLLPLEALPRVHVLLAVPPFAISTADAYRLLDAALEARGGSSEREETGEGRSGGAGSGGAPPAPRLHRAGEYRTWTSLAPRAANDFEAALFPAYPALPALKDALQASGAFLSLMTGSGSAVFGLFRSLEQLRAAHERLRGRFPDSAFIETCTDAGEREDLLG